jgi:hypothetical protein
MINLAKRTSNALGNDSLLALVGILIGIVGLVATISMRLYEPIGLIITAQVTALFYLVARNHLDETAGATVSYASISRFAKPVVMLSTLIVALACIFVMFSSHNAISRPISVFFIMAIVLVLIYLQSVVFADVPSIRVLVIIQIITLVIAVVMSSATVFPYNGGDTWTYAYDAEKILHSRTFRTMDNAYRDYPMYPVLIAVVSLYANVSVYASAQVINVATVLICVIMMYSLSVKIFDSKSQSLILVVLLVGSKWFVYWSTYIVSMVMTILFFVILFTVLYQRLGQKNRVADSIVLLLTTALVPFFHPVGAIAAVLLFIGFWLFERINLGFSRDRNQSIAVLTVFVAVVTIVQWVYFGQYVFERTIVDLARSLLRFIFDSGDVNTVTGYRDPVFYTIDQINVYILLSLAGIEILRQFRVRDHQINFHAGLLGLSFVVFGFATQAMGMQAVLPHRWLLYGTLLLVLPASSGFMLLFCRKSLVSRILGVIVVFVFFFTAITNTETNRDRPLYGEEITQQIELTSSEYSGVLNLEQIAVRKNAPARVDFRLYNYFKMRDVPSIQYWNEIQTDQYDGIFVTREVYMRRYFSVHQSYMELKRSALENAQFYDSGDFQLIDRVMRK